MTTYLNQLKTSLETGFETSMATEAKGFNNQAAVDFLAHMQDINTLTLLKAGLSKLNAELVDGYVYTHPLKAIIASTLPKITPEAIEVENGTLETIATLKKQLAIAKAALETQSKLHDKRTEKLNHTVCKLSFSAQPPHRGEADHHYRKAVHPKTTHSTCSKPTIFQP